jgi:hypothetical protein
MIELNNKEKEVLAAIHKAAEEVDVYGYFLDEDVLRYLNMTMNSFKGYLGSLKKKGIIDTWSGEAYYDGKILNMDENLFAVKNEYALGEEFELGLMGRLKVIGSFLSTDRCENCCFRKTSFKNRDCNLVPTVCGECSADTRSDKMDVYFIKT